MDNFRKILVSVDTQYSESHALERAAKLAKNTGAELRVVDVVHEVPPFVRKLYHRTNDVAEVLSGERADRIDELCAPIAEAGVNISNDVLCGRPFVELIREVTKAGCDLLVRDASGEREQGSLFFGSLDMRLLRNCPCPVWLVKPVPIKYYERVLVAIDPLPADDREEAQRTHTRSG